MDKNDSHEANFKILITNHLGSDLTMTSQKLAFQEGQLHVSPFENVLSNALKYCCLIHNAYACPEALSITEETKSLLLNGLEDQSIKFGQTHGTE